MQAGSRPANQNPTRWQDLLLDISIPLVFAVVTAAFFVLASQS